MFYISPQHFWPARDVLNDEVLYQRCLGFLQKSHGTLWVFTTPEEVQAAPEQGLRCPGSVLALCRTRFEEGDAWAIIQSIPTRILTQRRMRREDDGFILDDRLIRVEQPDMCGTAEQYPMARH